MSGTADRIKALCKARGITVRKFEIDCGFGNGYVRTMVKQDSTPNGKNITTIAHYFDVSEAYLLGEKELLNRVPTRCNAFVCCNRLASWFATRFEQ